MLNIKYKTLYILYTFYFIKHNSLNFPCIKNLRNILEYWLEDNILYKILWNLLILKFNSLNP